MIDATNDKNVRVLAVLKTILRLKPTQIAKAGKVSPCYITRLLKGEISGSDDFWSALNANLLKDATQSIFELSSNLPEAAEIVAALNLLKPPKEPIKQVA